MDFIISIISIVIYYRTVLPRKSALPSVHPSPAYKDQLCKGLVIQRIPQSINDVFMGPSVSASETLRAYSNETCLYFSTLSSQFHINNLLWRVCCQHSLANDNSSSNLPLVVQCWSGTSFLVGGGVLGSYDSRFFLDGLDKSESSFF